VITESLGGRVHRSRDGAVNLGAYYVRADYTNVIRFVDLGRRVDRLAIKRHDGAESYTYWDSRFLLHVPQALRFVELLFRFRRHYRVFKRRVPTVGQSVALQSDPWLMGLYQRPALDLIAEFRLGDLARWYVAPGLHGTAFVALGDVTAFTLLLGTLPLLVPTYEFTMRRERLVAGFSEAILSGTVTAIGRAAKGYLVDTATHGTWRATHVVVATPTGAAARLLDLPATRQPVTAHMFQVVGEPRTGLGHGDIHLFADTDPTFAVARQAEGSFLFCSGERDPDLGRFFVGWEIVDHHVWNPAFHEAGSEFLECEQGPNLFLVGDHNIVGLEDSYLTGLYAANRIVARSGPRRPREMLMSDTGFVGAPHSKAVGS
jgi:hypothetical protein